MAPPVRRIRAVIWGDDGRPYDLLTCGHRVSHDPLAVHGRQCPHCERRRRERRVGLNDALERMLEQAIERGRRARLQREAAANPAPNHHDDDDGREAA